MTNHPLVTRMFLRDGYTIKGHDYSEVLKAVERKEAIGYTLQGTIDKGWIHPFVARVVKEVDSHRLEDYF